MVSDSDPVREVDKDVEGLEQLQLGEPVTVNLSSQVSESFVPFSSGRGDLCRLYHWLMTMFIQIVYRSRKLV